jgi:DNA-directed RNA polymerase specialized sigma24 family protein
MAKAKNEYVNNKDFLAALVEYRRMVTEAEQNNGPRPRVPNYIGECVMKIATHLARKPNFMNYTFKDEMVADGIENCLQYIDNFDPEKSKNPFAYFTQIIWYAFLRRIQKEKKLLYTKYKMTEQVNLMNMTSDTQEHDSGFDFGDNIKMSEWSTEYMNNFIEEFEATKRRKVKKRENNV